MAEKYEATFHQGRPLPQRDPFATLASFDRTARPEVPPALDDEASYQSPGRPSWVAPEPDPIWPLVIICVMSAIAMTALCTGILVAI